MSKWERTPSVATLRRACRSLRLSEAELGKRLQPRYVPALTFIYDRSFEYGDKRERLLAKVKKEESGVDAE